MDVLDRESGRMEVGKRTPRTIEFIFLLCDYLLGAVVAKTGRLKYAQTEYWKVDEHFLRSTKDRPVLRRFSKLL